MTQRDPDLDALARDVATRATAAVSLAGIALIHLLDSIDTYADTRYLFWMYVALISPAWSWRRSSWAVTRRGVSRSSRPAACPRS